MARFITACRFACDGLPLFLSRHAATYACLLRNSALSFFRWYSGITQLLSWYGIPFPLFSESRCVFSGLPVQATSRKGTLHERPSKIHYSSRVGVDNGLNFSAFLFSYWRRQRFEYFGMPLSPLRCAAAVLYSVRGTSCLLTIHASIF